MSSRCTRFKYREVVALNRLVSLGPPFGSTCKSTLACPFTYNIYTANVWRISLNPASGNPCFKTKICGLRIRICGKTQHNKHGSKPSFCHTGLLFKVQISITGKLKDDGP